jgi:hypothetical protein
MENSRRTFIHSSVATLLLSQVSVGNAQVSSGKKVSSPGAPFFDSKSYSEDELVWLYQKRHLHPGTKFYEAQLAAAAETAPSAADSVFFYWDDTAKLLVNPYSLKSDNTLKTGSYTINAEVLNFHPSSRVNQDVLSSLDTNLQLVFRTQAADSNGDLITSITMAGLQFAGDYLSGKDSKLLTLSANNQLTNFPPSEQISIVDGQVSLIVGLAGQKKKSFWDDLVQIFQSFTNSPVFGLLPIPKLYSTAAQTVVALLNQVEQQQRLIPLLSGKKLDFRLYDGASTNPFLLKPGFWVLMNAQEAASHIDKTSHNINDLVLDIPGQLYEMKDKNGNAVDMTYCVSRVLLPAVKA